MIYRWPGFLTVVWLGSSSTPPLPPSPCNLLTCKQVGYISQSFCVSPVELTDRRGRDICTVHCKDKIPKFRSQYSQKRNIGVSDPISTCLWAIYIFPWLICLFCCRKYVDWSWEYMNRSQTHECGNWGLGRAIHKKGIHKWDSRCSVRMSILGNNNSIKAHSTYVL